MEAQRRLVRGMNKLVDVMLTVVLAVVMLYSGYALWDTLKVYNQASISNEIMNFKPTADDASNPSLAELQAINPNVCAWLTIDGTNIDYPLLQGRTNSEYLNKDIYGNYSLGGSVFLDCRSNRAFSDCYSLIYGHHMDGGAMFGDIMEFENRTFFDEHQTGWLFVSDMTYKLDIYAYMHVDAYASPMFDVLIDAEEFVTRLTHIQEEATYYRDIGILADDRIVALSTCSSATTNGRAIIVAKLVEYKDAGGEKKK